MYLIRIYPNEHKVRGQDYIAMAWSKVLANGNYDYDDIIRVFCQHKIELGIEISDADIAEIVNVQGIDTMNYYMAFGMVEPFCNNYWYDN